MSTSPGRRDCLFAMAAAIAAPRAIFAQEQYLPPVNDLRPLLASVARGKSPLLILFSTPGCPFCREVRRNYLVPRLADRKSALLLREVDITSPRPLIDAAGERTTDAGFATRFNVRVVPVVALFALLEGTLQLLTEPLVGLDRSGFYEGYLASAIEIARKRLQ